ncbi:50S ribosomal protein L29 [Mycoplasma sp. 1654_15]|uniref:50S ribosomal protein L29 n=1 Tax=Mycoplasma sp. 1654_15 TaxID=2725994 RepID=UPI00144990D1|nr:50S ribosomal protein L29 [Mycoplasma sp. 1654_15]QJB71210.1 50S ribosomal protein L29 [Mycoplasma sp. 1654_15]
MEFKDLKKKNSEELNKLLNEYKSELFTLRFRNKTQQLDHTHKIKQVRKDIARILTAIRQSELEQEKGRK